MKQRQFADESALYEALTTHLESAFSIPGAIAVFDADGTLWREDATEALLEWAESRGLLRPPAGVPDIRAYLDGAYSRSYADACRYCALAFAGHRVSDVLRWSDSSYRQRVATSGVSVTHRMVEWFTARGAEVHIVTASPWWAILPGAHALGVPRERLHGLALRERSGVLQPALQGRLQSGEGKAETVREVGGTPIFVAGNTVDDAAMMRLSLGTALAVEPMALEDDSRRLGDIAETQGWYVLSRSG